MTELMKVIHQNSTILELPEATPENPLGLEYYEEVIGGWSILTSVDCLSVEKETIIRIVRVVAGNFSRRMHNL